MTKITGKTYGILKRLPHFYHPEEVGELLLQVVEGFGRVLEQTEVDLYRVLHAHHVETADNEGSKGYTALPAKRGDLDKIFALYLEALGGTSQVVKMNPRFTVRSFNVRRLARLLIEDNSPLTVYLTEKFDNETKTLLERYHVDYSEFFCEAEIQPKFALALLLDSSPPITQYIRDRLAPKTKALLFAYGGGEELDPRLSYHIKTDLTNYILRDAAFFTNNYDYFNGRTLPAAAWLLLNGIYRDFLQQKYQQQTDPETTARLLKSLENVQPVNMPPGEDLVRLNRMLLEVAFPYDNRNQWGFRARGIPSFNQMRETLANAFNRLLDRDDLFDTVHFPALVENCASFKQQHQNELIWFNRRCVELAFPDEIEKSYVPYRERLRHLIQVLRQGASTRAGILEIVAANLGIVGDDPEDQAAKAQIEIEEFLPKPTAFFKGGLNFYHSFLPKNENPEAQRPEIRVIMLDSPQDSLIQKLANIRFVDETSGQRVHFKGQITAGDRLVFNGTSVLLNGVTSSAAVVGEVPAVPPGESRWRFEADLVVKYPPYPVGRFHDDEALMSRFDESVFASEDYDAEAVVKDRAIYPAGRFHKDEALASRFDESVFVSDNPVVSVELASYQYTPGIFTVTIPWHIQGFTDKFEETADHPRHQILTLVNRVKAAGVHAQVAYKQGFQEQHEQLVKLRLGIEGPLFKSVHALTDHFEIDSRQSNSEKHDVEDTLVLAGRFDYTTFDSLNTFA
jgi:hypothetical protein